MKNNKVYGIFPYLCRSKTSTFPILVFSHLIFMVILRTFYYTFIVILYLGMSQMLLAQKSLVKVNLAGVLSGVYSGQYEQVISKHISIGLTGGYLLTSFKEPIDTFEAKESERGYVVIPEVRYYLSKYENAPQSLFVGANVAYQKYEYTYDIPVDTLQTSGQITSLRFGALFGNQWILGKHFAIELFLNPAFVSSRVSGLLETRNPARYEAPQGISLRQTRIGVGIGFAF
ncbi:MAG TPA: DUF3575 domain-containing protein [Chitinophagales bacterium]|nr:DUF3575 domain-containing protein [Chitinophagales bacterium]